MREGNYRTFLPLLRSARTHAVPSGCGIEGRSKWSIINALTCDSSVINVIMPQLRFLTYIDSLRRRKSPSFWTSLGHKFQICGHIWPLRLFGGHSVFKIWGERPNAFQGLSLKAMKALFLASYCSIIANFKPISLGSSGQNIPKKGNLISLNSSRRSLSHLSFLTLPYPIYLLCTWHWSGESDVTKTFHNTDPWRHDSFKAFFVADCSSKEEEAEATLNTLENWKQGQGGLHGGQNWIPYLEKNTVFRIHSTGYFAISFLTPCLRSMGAEISITPPAGGRTLEQNLPPKTKTLSPCLIATVFFRYGTHSATTTELPLLSPCSTLALLPGDGVPVGVVSAPCELGITLRRARTHSPPLSQLVCSISPERDRWGATVGQSNSAPRNPREESMGANGEKELTIAWICQK